MGKKFSELERAVSLNNGDLAAFAQVDQSAATGYKSKAAPMSLVSQKILKDTEYASDFQTDDKTVLGAINEVNSRTIAYDVVSGPIVNFKTSLELPIKSLGIDVNAVQDAGTPTTAAPLPISGWSAIKIEHVGKNLTNANATTTYTVFWGTDVVELISFLNTLPVGRYTISNKYKINETPSSGKVIHGTFLIRALVNGTVVNVTSYAVVTDNNPFVGKVYQESVSFEITDEVKGKINHVYAYCDQDNPHSGSGRGSYDCYDIQIETGSASTDFEPYDGDEYIINLGGTYYGGHLTQDKDGHRRFEVTCAKQTADLSNITPTTANGYDSWLIFLNEQSLNAGSSADKKCNVCGTYRYEGSAAGNEHFYIGSNAFVLYLIENTYRSGTVEFSYPLATPYVIDLPDGDPIVDFQGVNNIYADSGDASVEYALTIEEYIDKKIASVQALILNS